MLNTLNNWLENPQRDYSEGLRLFKLLADEQMKATVGAFLDVDEGDESVLAIRMPMLTNKLTTLFMRVRLNPTAYAAAFEAFSQSASPKADTKKVVALQERIQELEDELEALQEDAETNADLIQELEGEIENKQNEITELKGKLSEQGIRVITPEDLPEELKKKYARNKEIVPLMASLHADLKSEGIDDATRKNIADELCQLDDERRQNWDCIDNYLQRGSMEMPEERLAVYSDDPIVRGGQIAKRIERLKENIKRSEEAFAKHQESGKTHLCEKAQARIEAYSDELDKLMSEMNG